MKLIERIVQRPERNVGRGDFATRLLATFVLGALVVTVMPQANVEFPMIKISLLAATEVGLITLMLGLFLDTKTHYAGLQMFLGSLAMFWLARRQLPWAAAAVGVAIIAVGIINLVTRRSRFNQVFNLSSIREVIESTP
ncbi:MAG: hypothetical protein JNK82_05015 [Myxococcaceae bacterium]|nr:hypothetical protein [Myxococcaceae bacterium]